eukprot:1177707-Prorocentrum_minimum.AAC.2
MVSTRSRKEGTEDDSPAAKRARIERVEYNPPHSVFTDMQVLRAMWFPNIKGDTHQEQLESFYKTQAHLYDSYRCRMLHGRKPLVKAMPANKGDVWVDLGGGTGSNLEFFGANINDFKKVVVVDLTPSLVQVSVFEDTPIRSDGFYVSREDLHVAMLQCVQGTRSKALQTTI